MLTGASQLATHTGSLALGWAVGSLYLLLAGAWPPRVAVRSATRSRQPGPTVRHLSSTQLYSCDIVGSMSQEPSVPHPLPEPLVDLVAGRFRVLGEPMRIKLLDQLRDGDATVHELQVTLGASQQNVSKHLGVLSNAGIVSRTKRGTSSVYSIADPGVFELCDQVCGGLRRQVAELDAILQGGQAA
jgi:DNA-binding transcriptional ArsR family regulator